jgi:hypothetical protein
MPLKASSVHDGQLFANNVLGDCPRTASEKDMVMRMSSSPDSVMSITRPALISAAALAMWSKTVRVTEPVVEPVVDSSTQTPPLGNDAEDELRRRAIVEDVRAASGNAPMKFRRRGA